MWGKTVTVLGALIVMTACDSSGTDKVDFQGASKMKLEEQLRDAGSAKYSEVRAHRISAENEPMNYAFCGLINAKNGFGGYVGDQSFFANPLIAAIDDGSKGFDKLWRGYCDHSTDDGEVWF